MALKFPALGSLRTVDLVKKPAKEDFESEESFQIELDNHKQFKGVRVTLKLASPKEVRGVRMAWFRALREEQKRIADLPEDAIERKAFTDTGYNEFLKVNADTCRLLLDSVSGFEVGDRDISSFRDNELIDALIYTNLIGMVAAVCREYQDITPTEKK